MPEQDLENEVQENEKTEKKWKRRRYGSLRWILMVLLCMLTFSGGFAFARSPVFDVTEISVEGTQQLDAEYIKDISGLTVGRNIFAEDIALAKYIIRMEVLVEDVHVDRRLPGRLQIRVQERQSSAYVQAKNAYYLVDGNGCVLRIERVVGKLDKPVISGVGDLPDEIYTGDTLSAASLKTALGLLAEMPENAIGALSELNVAQPQNILLYMQNGVQVRFGDASDAAEKSQLILDICAQQENYITAGKLAYLDVSVVAKPVVSYK